MNKILFVLPEFKFGGTVYSTLNMVSLLDRNMYDIYVLPMTHQGPMKNEYEKMGIKLLPENILLSSIYGNAKEEKRFLVRLFFYVIKTLRRICMKLGHDFEMNVVHFASRKYSNMNFDVVASCQEGSPTKLASEIKAKKNIAWFRCEASKYFPNLPTVSYKSYYEKFDKIICVSQCTCEDFKRTLPQFADKTIAIHNAQNLADIYSKANGVIDDARFNTSRFTLISLGRMNPSKRMADIPHVAKKLKDSGCSFNWYILGDGNVGNEQNKCLNNINALGVADCVHYLGGKINPYPYILHSDLLVSLSLVEACPRVVNEALILKKPCICTDFASAREFVFDGKNGYVEKLEGIADILHNLITNISEYEELKHYCDKFVFDNQPILDSLNKIFN